MVLNWISAILNQFIKYNDRRNLLQTKESLNNLKRSLYLLYKKENTDESSSNLFKSDEEKQTWEFLNEGKDAQFEFFLNDINIGDIKQNLINEIGVNTYLRMREYAIKLTNGENSFENILNELIKYGLSEKQSIELIKLIIREFENKQ
ncbi:MAG: hypothetical protein FJZ67_11185 [Bacteroidetes bacterium]|nr:hypothetical protein [Bacteroidota bacterium]